MAPVSTRSVGDKRKAANRPATSQPKDSRSNGERRDGMVEVDARALEELIGALDAARRGDFSVRLSKRRKGVLGDVAASYNELVETNQRMTKELVRIARIIGREGQ